MTGPKSILTTLLVALSLLGQAQEWDFLSWYRLKAGGDLTKKISMSVEQQVRLHENSTRVEQTFTEIGLVYDLPKGFELAAAYRFSWVQNTDQSYKNRHRYNIDLGYGKKFWKLKADFRARFQHRPSTYLINERLEPEASPMVVRLKWSVSYTKLKKWVPGLAFEAFIRLEDPELRGVNKFRYKASLARDLPKRMEVGMFYMLETEYSGDTPSFVSVVGINFSYDWKRPKKKKKKKDKK